MNARFLLLCIANILCGSALAQYYPFWPDYPSPLKKIEEIYAAQNISKVTSKGFDNVVMYLDEKGRDTLITENGNVLWRSVYNDVQRASFITKYKDSIETYSVEFYNDKGDLLKWYRVGTDSVEYSYNYDSLNRMVYRTCILHGDTTFNTFTYNNTGQLTAINGTCYKSGRDSLGVLLQYNENGQLLLTYVHPEAILPKTTFIFGSYVADSIQYIYNANGQISRITYCENQIGIDTRYRHKAVFSYEYNNRGLVKSYEFIKGNQRRRITITYTYRK